MKPRTHLIYLLNALAMTTGAYYFYRLNWFESIPMFKLFNVWGIFFDILAVILLSSFLPLPCRLKKFIIEDVSFESIAFLLFFTCGVLITSGFAVLMGLPSTKVLVLFHVSLLIPLAVVWFLIEDFVSNPVFERLKDNDFRLQVFGSVFLIGGLTLQFIGAVLDISE